MADRLTWDEIKSRYPDEWVVLVEYTHDDNEDIHAGVVYDHGPQRDQVYDRCQQVPSPFAVRYTGEIRGGLIGFYADDVDAKS
jgi:hypothetical protein